MKRNSSAFLLSPKFFSTHQCLSFRYYMYGLGIGQLKVYVQYDNYKDVLWILHGSQQTKKTKWKRASVSLNSSDPIVRRKVSFLICLCNCSADVETSKNLMNEKWDKNCLPQN